MGSRWVGSGLGCGLDGDLSGFSWGGNGGWTGFRGWLARDSRGFAVALAGYGCIQRNVYGHFMRWPWCGHGSGAVGVCGGARGKVAGSAGSAGGLGETGRRLWRGGAQEWWRQVRSCLAGRLLLSRACRAVAGRRWLGMVKVVPARGGGMMLCWLEGVSWQAGGGGLSCCGQYSVI